MNKNIELIKTVRSVDGNDIDLMADVYMGWTFEYAKRMMRLIDNENLRWLEEPVIADDIHGYAELNNMNAIPISGGEHEFNLFGFNLDEFKLIRNQLGLNKSRFNQRPFEFQSNYRG